MLGVVPKNPIDHFAIEKLPALFAKNFEIGAARADVERLVDRQAGPVERQDDRKAGADGHRNRQSTGRSIFGLRVSGPHPGLNLHCRIDFDSSCDRFSPRNTPTSLLVRLAGGQTWG